MPDAPVTTETAEKAPSIRRRALSWARDLVLFGAVLLGVFWFQTRSHVDTGQVAPTWERPTLNGQTVSLETFKGKPTVLFFWAPWCGVCKADAHNIAAVKKAVGDDANVVSVAMSFDSLDSVRSFVAENEIESPVVLGDRKMAMNYAIDAFPTVYVLDKDGRIASSAVGYTTEFGLRFRLFLAK